MNSITQGTQIKVIAAIPCFNEQQFIADIVSRAKKHVDEVIVVDDGSTDATANIAQAAGAIVIRHMDRGGAGVATRAAFQAATTSNADILVTLDGDGQHNPDEIPQLLAPILQKKADLVIGSRFIEVTQQTNIRWYRKFGIDVINWLYNVGAKVKVSDSQSGFRAHSRKLFDTVAITENGFGFSVQVLIQARNKGLRVKEVPISCIYHPNGSTLNPIIHGLSVAWSVIKLRLSSGK
jgi:glycosyltransferase involved in cell wall biosynthesis